MSYTRYKIDDLHDHAAARGGKCLSIIYSSKDVRYNWECKRGHLWSTSWWNIIRGNTWCPKCSKTCKHTIDKLKAHGVSMGGRCLSDVYINSMVKYRWECKNGHIWDAIWNSVNQGKWCPVCAGNVKHKIKQLHDYAVNSTGKCLSLIYVNSDTKYEWECKNGHTWHATWHDVTCGTWCPSCSHGGFNPLKPGWLYIILLKSKSESFIKIGISNNYSERFLDFERCGYIVEQILLKRFDIGISARKLEIGLHNMYKDYKYLPRIDFGGKTECFHNVILEDILSNDIIQV